MKDIGNALTIISEAMHSCYIDEQFPIEFLYLTVDEAIKEIKKYKGK